MDQPYPRRITLITLLLSLLWNGILILLVLCIQDDVHLQKPLQVTVEDESKKDTQDTSIFIVDQLVSFGRNPDGDQITVTPLPLSANPSLKTVQSTVATQHQIWDKSDFSQEKEIQKQQNVPEYSSEPTEKHSETANHPEVKVDVSDSIVPEQKFMEIVQSPEADIKKESHQNLFVQKNIPAQKKQLSLADVAKGYMRQVSKEKESSIDYQMRSAMPKTQLALSVYSSRIYEILQQSAKVNEKMLYTPETRTVDVVLILTINRDGRLLDTQIDPPIKEKEMRKWIFDFINRTGLFPPIPQHLNKKKLTINMPLTLYMNQGFDIYSLHYGLGQRR